MVKFRLSSWRKLRRAFFGREKETLSEYIERLSKEIIKGKHGNAFHNHGEF